MDCSESHSLILLPLYCYTSLFFQFLSLFFHIFHEISAVPFSPLSLKHTSFSKTIEKSFFFATILLTTITTAAYPTAQCVLSYLILLYLVLHCVVSRCSTRHTCLLRCEVLGGATARHEELLVRHYTLDY